MNVLNDYVTVQQAANLLNVSEQTIRNYMVKKKYFKAKKIGGRIFIDMKSLQKYIEDAYII